jgi:hypothetical protein
LAKTKQRYHQSSQSCSSPLISTVIVSSLPTLQHTHTTRHARHAKTVWVLIFSLSLSLSLSLVCVCADVVRDAIVPGARDFARGGLRRVRGLVESGRARQ